MEKHYEIEKEDGWRLTVRIKGRKKWDTHVALTEVLYRLERGDHSGADSTDAHAYSFKLEVSQ